MRKGDGGPFAVFTPLYRSWKAHGWPAPRTAPPRLPWAEGLRSDGVPAEPAAPASLPPPGEAAALDRLEQFLAGPASTYDTRRDNPAADATTHLSPYLKYGCIHPRQVLDRLGRSKAQEKLRSELAWREFYADVLWHQPATARRSLQPAMAAMAAMAAMRLDTGAGADRRFEAWSAGLTGYPLIDAGMRQLLAEAWMPNRLRLVVSSFL